MSTLQVSVSDSPAEVCSAGLLACRARPVTLCSAATRSNTRDLGRPGDTRPPLTRVSCKNVVERAAGPAWADAAAVCAG